MIDHTLLIGSFQPAWDQWRWKYAILGQDKVNGPDSRKLRRKQLKLVILMTMSIKDVGQYTWREPTFAPLVIAYGFWPFKAS